MKKKYIIYKIPTYRVSIYIIFLLISIIIFPVNAEDSLSLYFSFEEESGSFVKDNSLNKNHGFLHQKGGNNYVLGKEGLGVKTGENFGFINITPNASLNLKDSFTICFWVKPIQFGDKTKLFSKRSSKTRESFIVIGEDNGYLYSAIGGISRTDILVTPKTDILELNTWNFVALSLDSINKKLNLYLNSKLISSQDCSYNLNDSTSDITIGADLEGTQYIFDGIFDEFKIFNKALSHEQILAVFNKDKIIETLKEEEKTNEIANEIPKEESQPIVKEQTSIESASIKSDEPTPLTQENISSEIKYEKDQVSEIKNDVSNTTSLIPKHNESRMQEYEKLYESQPALSLKLDIINFFKKYNILSHFSFDNLSNNVLCDELNSDITLTSNKEYDSIIIKGKQGKGIFISNNTTIESTPIKIRMPRTFSLKFSMFPINFEDNAVFMTFVSQDNKFLIELFLKNDQLFLKTSKNDSIPLGITLMEKNWQDIMLSYCVDNEEFYFFKNNILISSFKIKEDLSSNIKLIIGKYQDNNAIDFILDEILLFKSTFKENIIFPDIPSNPLIAIKEGTIIEVDKINILIFCKNASEFMISQNPNFIDGRWKPYQRQISLPSDRRVGKHTIYCKFRNESNLESNVIEVEYIYGSINNKEIEFIYPLANSHIPGKR